LYPSTDRAFNHKNKNKSKEVIAPYKTKNPMNSENKKQLEFQALYSAYHALATYCHFLLALHKRNLKTQQFKQTLPSRTPCYIGDRTVHKYDIIDPKPTKRCHDSN